MKISKTSKIERVVSKDPTAPVLLHPFLRIEPGGGGTLLASDKFSAVVMPVEVEQDDVSGPVHVEAIKAARKLDGTIRCSPEHCILPSEVAYHRDTKVANFPPVDKLLVDTGTIEVSLDAKTLLAIAQAMGTDTITLKIQPDGLPIGVEPHPSMPHVAGARAAMMPYRIPGSL